MISIIEILELYVSIKNNIMFFFIEWR